MPAPELRSSYEQSLYRGPRASTPQTLNTGGTVEDRGDTTICSHLQVPSDKDTWAGGDRHHFLACGSQRIAAGRLHRWLGWGEVRAQQGPQGLCTQGPTQGWAVLLLSDNAGRDLGKGVRGTREMEAKGFSTCCSSTWHPKPSMKMPRWLAPPQPSSSTQSSPSVPG